MKQPSNRDNPMHVEKLAFSYRETAKAAGISESMVRKLVRAGKLEAVRIGRARRVSREALLRLCGIEAH